MPQPGKPSGKSKPRVIAAIPSLNTESAIGEVVAKARRHVDQVIVINDGSHDGTAEKAAAAGATVINHQATKGYGEAIKSCFEVAKASEADFLVILDGDGQHNPDEIPKLLDPVIKGEADKTGVLFDLAGKVISKNVTVPKTLSKDEQERLAKSAAYVDKDDCEYPKNYKLQHHDPSSGEVELARVKRCMENLLGSSDYPNLNLTVEAQKESYNHLAAHYKENDLTAPDFKYVSAQVLKNLPGDYEFDDDTGLVVSKNVSKVDKDDRDDDDEQVLELEGDLSKQDNYIRTFRAGMESANAQAENKGRGLNLARFVKCLAASKGIPDIAHRLAKKAWGDDDLVTKALASDTFTAGGVLVPPSFSDDVIELLRPRSVVRSMNPVVMDMPNGTLTLPKLTGGSTASYVGEGTDISESQPVFGDLKLVFKKLVALVPISNDLLNFASSRSEGVIRDDIITGLATREDVAFIRDDGTQDTPKGLRHWAPAGNVIDANATVNLDNVTVDLGKLVLALKNANVRMIRPAFFMTPRSENYLMTVRDGNGNYAFRDEMLAGSLWRFPYATTTQIPDNLGGGSDESEIYLVDMADAIIGEAQSMKIDASGEASYVSGGQLVSAFSKDQTVIRAITEHDFGMRHDASIAVLDVVKWGA